LRKQSKRSALCASRRRSAVMRLSFRVRILLTLLPLLVLLAVIGGAAAVLLVHLGGRIDAILKENYESVRYMQELRESLEEIDASFQLALAGQESDVLTKYLPAWEVFDEQVK